MAQGTCRLCNHERVLTFEHVPPRAVFNKETRYRTVKLLDYFQDPDPLNFKANGKLHQGGIGYYSLCRDCNNFLGRTYVNDFKLYSNAFISSAKKVQFNRFSLTMHGFSALNVLKQIISMFFSFNSLKFSQQNRDLANFILSADSKLLPERFRVFNYLNTEGSLRNIPVMVKGNLGDGHSITGSELAFPPLGHVLTIDFNGNLPCLQEITFFKDIELNAKVDSDLDLYRLPTHLPILLDYRSKSAIIENITNSQN